MKERIKSLVLFLLVGLSIFMTTKLWFVKGFETVKVKDIEVIEDSKYVLYDMISPNKYLLNFGFQNHTMLYDDTRHDMWLKGSESLKYLFSNKNLELEEISNTDYSKYLNEKSIVYTFSEKTNSYIIARSLNISKPNNIVDTMPKIDKIYIYLGQSDPFFILSNDDKILKVPVDEINNLSLKAEVDKIADKGNYPYYYPLKDTFAVANDIFIPLEVNYKLPQVFVENKIKFMDEEEKSEIAQKFLNQSIDYVREIVEGNNSTIYLYDQEMLKLNSNGVIEYFNPIREVIKERNLYQSLTTAANFLEDKSKLKEGMYLANIDEIEQDGNFGYRLTIRYRIRGIPVILGNREVNEYVKIDVFNNHVRSYYQLLREDTSKVINKITAEKEMMSAFDVIDKNYALLESKYIESNREFVENSEENIESNILVDEILNSILDVTLAYFDPCVKDENEQLIAVWVVQFNDMLLAFDAYTGMLTHVRGN